MKQDYKSKVILDTCVLLRFFLNEEGADKVNEVLKKVEAEKVKGYVSVLTITELIVILTRAVKNSDDLDEGIVWKCPDYVFKTLIIVPVSADIAIIAAKYKLRYTKKGEGKRGLSYVDGVIVGTAQKLESSLLTYDPEFTGIEEVEIVSPEKFSG